MADFIPVIVGTDLNTYYMGASFHEAYGVKPYLLGQMKLGYTKYSDIFAKTKLVENLSTDSDVFVNALIDYAHELDYQKQPLVLVGTNDEYVRLIIENQDVLKKYYHFRVLSEEMREMIQDKANFYELAEKHGLDIPDTQIYQMGDPIDFEVSHFPVILKPNNSVEYNAHPFPGKAKVYRLNSMEEIKATIKNIASGGYSGKLLIQEYIEGDDSYNWDAVVYMNGDSEAQFVALGQVALQEHQATAIGNYTAIISRYNRPIMEKLKKFLEEIHYVGFANFDMKYDARTDTLKVFEINVRQGRSSYYVTQTGHNLAKYLVDDVVYHKSHDCTFINAENLLTVVPIYILDKYITDPTIHDEAMTLIKNKKWGNPLFYKQDFNLMRRPYLFVRQMRYREKYKNAKW